MDPENPSLPVCKYCLENSLECKSPFVKPCRCTDPVCLNCLRRQIELKRTIICEICKTTYVITADMNIIYTPEPERMHVTELVDFRDPLMDNAWSQYVIDNYASSDDDHNPKCTCLTGCIAVFILMAIIYYIFFH